MKSSLFSLSAGLALASFFVLSSLPTSAQDTISSAEVSEAVVEPRELPVTAIDTKRTTVQKYNSNVTRGRRRWNRLMPRYTKVQLAGNMGIISIGMGWDYGKKRQWEKDIMLGYVPKYSTTHGKVTLTLKQNFMPWRVHLRGKAERFMIEPLTCGLYVNSMLDGDFWLMSRISILTHTIRFPRRYASTCLAVAESLTTLATRVSTFEPSHCITK